MFQRLPEWGTASVRVHLSEIEESIKFVSTKFGLLDPIPCAGVKCGETVEILKIPGRSRNTNIVDRNFVDTSILPNLIGFQMFGERTLYSERSQNCLDILLREVLGTIPLPSVTLQGSAVPGILARRRVLLWRMPPALLAVCAAGVGSNITRTRRFSALFE